MSEFFDWNPARGTWYEVDDYNGGLAIHTKQNVQPVIDYAKAVKNAHLSDRRARKHDFLLYATIPAHVELEIKEKYGFSIHDKNCTKKLLQVINTDYPYLRCSNLKHELPR